MHAVVVPSPLLGVAVYSPFGRALTHRGYDVTIADPEVPVGLGDAEDGGVSALLESLVEQCAGADLVIPHSNAGRFAPEIADGSGPRWSTSTRCCPASATAPASPTSSRARSPRTGCLPGWTEWWPAEDLLDVVPEEWLSVLEQSQPRLDPAFLLHDPPTPPTWYAQPAAYLRLGDGYRAEADAARALGWPVRELVAGHLHMVVDPEQVAAEVSLLASGILASGS